MIKKRLPQLKRASVTGKAGLSPHATWLLLYITILSGCATPSPTVAPNPPPAPSPDRFQPVPDYQYLPNPASAGEREVLGRLEQELTLLEGLVREAQDQRNPAARTQFRYDLLNRDLEAIRHGIRQHLQGPGTEPREFKPLRGDYRG